jgi:hypothetical protein
MEYYYTDGVNNYGPYSLEQLKDKNITSKTRVWYSGLEKWTIAGDVPELAGILVSAENSVHMPPPVERASAISQNVTGIPPKTYFAESILVTLFCCQPFGVVGIVYAAMVEAAIAAGNFAEANRLSLLAAKWTKIAFFSGLAFYVLLILFYGTIFLTAIKDVPAFQNF